MARVSSNQDLQSSVLDRLIDENPDAKTEQPQSYRQKLREIYDSVKRDLEDLLNTRQRCEGWPEGLQQLKHSLVNYGLPDFMSMNLAAKEQRKAFARIIEDAIKLWEPRLDRVKVVLLDGDDELDRSVQFRISALLRIGSTPEPIVFDSTLEPMTCNFKIMRSGNG